MPITKNGHEWHTPDEIWPIIMTAPSAPIRITTAGWEDGKEANLRTKGMNNQGSMGYYLIQSTLNLEPYWRFTTEPPTPPFVLDESIDFQC